MQKWMTTRSNTGTGRHCVCGLFGVFSGFEVSLGALQSYKKT